MNFLFYSLDKHRGKKTLPQAARRKGQVDNIKQTQQSTDNIDNRNLLQNTFLNVLRRDMRIQWPYWLQSHKRVSKDKTNRIFDFLLKTYWISPSLLILFPCQTGLTLLIKGLFHHHSPDGTSFFYGKWLMISVSNNTWFRLHVCTCKVQKPHVPLV